MFVLHAMSFMCIDTIAEARLWLHVAGWLRYTRDGQFLRFPIVFPRLQTAGEKDWVGTTVYDHVSDMPYAGSPTFSF